MNNTEMRLRQFTPNSEIHFERIGITEEQIKTFHLPTRPTKKSDTRAKAFGSDISVELTHSHLKHYGHSSRCTLPNMLTRWNLGVVAIEKQERKT